MKLLVNGEIAGDPSNLPFSDSLLRGDGLFETILGIGESPIAWPRHYARLAKAAEQISISIPARIDLDLSLTKLLAGVVGKSKIRLTVLADGNWMISLEAVEESNKPVTLMRMKERVSSKAVLAGVKSISYGQSMSAVRRAQAAGYTDAIFVNENDHVVESGFSNLIILTENGFVTPADESGCLPGVMREILLSSFGVNQSLFTYEQLLHAQGIYTCSSIRLIQHVSKVDDTLFSESANGRKLIGDFADFLQSKITP